MAEREPTLFERLKGGVENNPVLALALVAGFVIAGLKPLWNLAESAIRPATPSKESTPPKPDPPTDTVSKSARPAERWAPGTCRLIVVDPYLRSGVDDADGRLHLMVAGYQVILSGAQLRQPSIFVVKTPSPYKEFGVEAKFVSDKAGVKLLEFPMALLYMDNSPFFQVSWADPSSKFPTVLRREPISWEDLNALVGERRYPACAGLTEMVTRVR